MSDQVQDPYSYLALHVFRQAFRDIEAYYTGKGRQDEIAGGKDALAWIFNMKGTYRTMCLCSDLPVEKLHQLCLHKIHVIKEHAYELRFGN